MANGPKAPRMHIDQQPDAAEAPRVDELASVAPATTELGAAPSANVNDAAPVDAASTVSTTDTAAASTGPTAAGASSAAASAGQQGATSAAGTQSAPASAATPGRSVASLPQRISAWVHSSFPGHEHAFWGAVIGLCIALLVFVIGIFRALFVAVIVCLGIVVGGYLDGDTRIMDIVERMFGGRG